MAGIGFPGYGVPLVEQGAYAGQQAAQPQSNFGDTLAQVAPAAGGATQTLVSLMAGNRVKKKQKKIAKIQALERERDFKEQIRQSQMNEADAIRFHGREVNAIGASMASRGLAHSSARTEAIEDAKYNDRRRIDAIRVARTRLRQGYEAGLRIADIQKKIEKIQQQEAAIAAGIDTVVSVASIICDRNQKVNVQPIDLARILQQVEKLPLATWTYEWEQADVRHVGPMSQDWHKIMRLGYDTTKIDVVDAFGVALASIKALTEIARSQQAQIDGLKKRLEKVGR